MFIRVKIRKAIDIFGCFFLHHIQYIINGNHSLKYTLLIHHRDGKKIVLCNFARHFLLCHRYFHAYHFRIKYVFELLFG